jgi:hypothetical protein
MQAPPNESFDYIEATIHYLKLSWINLAMHNSNYLHDIWDLYQYATN